MIIFAQLTTNYQLPTFVTGFSMVTNLSSGKIEFNKNKIRLEITINEAGTYNE